MSLTLFKGALGDVGLLAKTRTALGASSDEAWCRQTISGLQLLETVLSQMKNLSPTIATEETRRIVELCRLACAPILENFMQELERLEPDLDRYFVAGEDNPDVESPPLWATTVERNMTTLMRGIGMQLQLVNALFQVESLQDRTANGETQQISRTPPDPVSLKPATTTSSQQFIVTGNENAYQGIQIGGSARAHIGNSYSYIGVPKASVDKLSESLNDLATSRQADGLLSLLQGIRKKQSDGCNALTILDARTQQVLEQLGQVAEGSRAMLALFQKSSPPNMASAEQLRSLGSRASEHSSKSNVPTKAHSGQQYGKLPKDQDANQLTNMALVLEIIRIWLSTMIMMLLMGSRSIQSFIRSARTITRSPSMLLESNIKIFDVLNRELSLPYEHFRYWPVVLARLQCEFKGFPGESHIMRKKFGLFRAAKRFRNESIISFDDWESSVSPGDQVLMSIDVEQFDPDKCPSCGCALREMHLSPGFSKCVACRQSVLTLRDDSTDEVFRASRTYGPDKQDTPSKTPAEVLDIRRFARVHGRDRTLAPRDPSVLDLTEENLALFEGSKGYWRSHRSPSSTGAAIYRLTPPEWVVKPSRQWPVKNIPPLRER